MPQMMGESAYGLAVSADRADADSMFTVAVIALSEAPRYRRIACSVSG
jgi:hypothetical protein